MEAASAAATLTREHCADLIRANARVVQALENLMRVDEAAAARDKQIQECRNRVKQLEEKQALHFVQRKCLEAELTEAMAQAVLPPQLSKAERRKARKEQQTEPVVQQ